MGSMPAIRARVAALAAAAAFAVVPAAAEGAWTVRGHGYGHGVGLSQWGAYGYAKHGSGYRQILGHYYTNTRLGRAGGRVRVLLGSGEGAVRLLGRAQRVRKAPATWPPVQLRGRCRRRGPARRRR